jgi:hypothetical protein
MLAVSGSLAFWIERIRCWTVKPDHRSDCLIDALMPPVFNSYRATMDEEAFRQYSGMSLPNMVINLHIPSPEHERARLIAFIRLHT